MDAILAGEIDLIVNTPYGVGSRLDGYEIRTAAVLGDKPLFTSMAQVSAAVASIDVSREGMTVTSLQDYQRRRDEQRGAAV